MTGVQTCALPISDRQALGALAQRAEALLQEREDADVAEVAGQQSQTPSVAQRVGRDADARNRGRGHITGLVEQFEVDHFAASPVGLSAARAARWTYHEVRQHLSPTGDLFPPAKSLKSGSSLQPQGDSGEGIYLPARVTITRPAATALAHPLAYPIG